MDILAEARRRAFSTWLRTGRIPGWLRTARAEFKYNPWHDPDDGRFTFAGTGRYFGRGSSGGLTARMHERVNEPPPFGGYDRGRSGGGGASGDWPPPAGQQSQDEALGSPRKRAPRPPGNPGTSGRPTRSATDNPRNWRRIEANGYVYRVDAVGRTRRVTGLLELNRNQPRSRSAQARAGGRDRLRSDHGGHYIARRFNGPKEAFNHFAQDASFNRREYSALENQWARALHAGKRVLVKIDPSYEGTSQRPTMLKVTFWIDGAQRSVRFPNERRERTDARQ